MSLSADHSEPSRASTRTGSGASEIALNAPQAEAVVHTDGPLLIFAGAGSGKTRVITYRIANLVARANVLPWRILAVTFTNKAAGEMRSRLADPSLLGPVAQSLWVGTFHAICAKLLRLFPEAIGRTRGFVIYDSTDQKAVMTRAIRDLNLDEKRYPPKQVLARVLKEKQEGRGPEDMNLDTYVDDVIKKAYVKYEESLRASNALDFEDLILSVVRIVEAPREGASADVLAAQESLAGMFDYVLVDEFQDTNAIQSRLIRGLAARTRNVCVVGDDDQSIYRWRGADVRNIRQFRKSYPDAKVIKLEQNYRSTRRIVHAALSVIAHSAAREPKELWTSNDDGFPIRVVACADERDEAACVVRAVADARAAGIPAIEMAVFYRVHAQSRVLEEALRAAGMHYRIVGGMKFYERAEVKDALSYLRILVNPASDVDLLRVINTPVRGIGATTIERLCSYASERGVSVYQALRAGDSLPDVLGKPAKKKLIAFGQLLDELVVAAADSAPTALLKLVLRKTGYVEALKAEDSAEADGRLENLAELEGSILDFETEAQARGEAPTLEGFLERVSLHSDSDQKSAGEDATETITLMTVHSAKGLEFHLVLLTGMEEGMFPYQGFEPRDAEEMDEERRLAYVAITRAREHLVITHVRQRQIFGTTRMGTPSRFVGDIPSDIVDHLETPAARAMGASASSRSSYGSGFGSTATSGRWIDRSSHREGRLGAQPEAARGRTARDTSGSSSAPASLANGLPMPRDARQPGERYVEYDHGSQLDAAADGDIMRGSSVEHAKFGRGEVLSVSPGNDPSVVAYFPGWGEKKVLLRFLTRG